MGESRASGCLLTEVVKAEGTRRGTGRVPNNQGFLLGMLMIGPRVYWGMERVPPCDETTTTSSGRSCHVCHAFLRQHMRRK